MAEQSGKSIQPPPAAVKKKPSKAAKVAGGAAATAAAVATAVVYGDDVADAASPDVQGVAGVPPVADADPVAVSDVGGGQPTAAAQGVTTASAAPQAQAAGPSGVAMPPVDSPTVKPARPAAAAVASESAVVDSAFEEARAVLLERVESFEAPAGSSAEEAQELRDELREAIERFEPRPGQSTEEALAELRRDYDERVHEFVQDQKIDALVEETQRDNADDAAVADGEVSEDSFEAATGVDISGDRPAGNMASKTAARLVDDFDVLAAAVKPDVPTGSEETLTTTSWREGITVEHFDFQLEGGTEGFLRSAETSDVLGVSPADLAGAISPTDDVASVLGVSPADLAGAISPTDDVASTVAQLDVDSVGLLGAISPTDDVASTVAQLDVDSVGLLGVVSPTDDVASTVAQLDVDSVGLLGITSPIDDLGMLSPADDQPPGIDVPVEDGPADP